MFNNLIILYLILSILSFILILESISLIIVSIKAITINRKFERLSYDYRYIDNKNKESDIISELEILRKRAEILMWYDRFDKKQCLDLINGRIKELKGE